jgi:hypothetical protein
MCFLKTPLPDYNARAISNYLTSETGVTVIFESAIVPKWKDSRISFKNVYISRRPSSPSPTLSTKHSGHMAAVGYDVSNHPAYHHVGEEEEEAREAEVWDEEQWSKFDLNVDSIDVTLSLWRWLDGKGLIEDAVVQGVRGVLGMFPWPLFQKYSANTLSDRPPKHEMGPIPPALPFFLPTQGRTRFLRAQISPTL